MYVLIYIFPSPFLCYRTMRYTAYRQTVRWCYGYLGKYNRRPLPSCAMHKIRNKFPEPGGQYVEFKFVDL